MSAMKFLVGAVCAGLASSPSLASAASDAGSVGTSVDSGTLLGDVAQQVNTGHGQFFVALLRPMNTNVTGTPARGIAVVRIDGDLLEVSTFATGVSPNMQHMQHIHGFVSGALAACPPSIADVNKDGVIDVVEGVPFYGAILVPLDSNLNDLNPQTFPTASPEGTLRYQQTGSVSAIEAQLGAPLNPEIRVIALHGVPPNAPLPPTTQTLPGLTPAFTLPVACGELVRVK